VDVELRKETDDRVQAFEAVEFVTSAGDWEKAASLWAKFRRRYPEDPLGYAKGAAALRQAGHLAAAFKLASAATKRFPRDALSAFEHGWTVWSQGDAAATAQISAKLRKRFPSRPDGFSLGVLSLVGLGRFDEAEELAKKSRRRFPKEETLWVEYAIAPNRRGDWAETERRLAPLRKRFRSNATLWTLGVAVLRESGKFEAAETLAEQAMALFPNDIEPFLEHARVAGAHDRWQEMFERCQNLRHRFSDDPRAESAAIAALRGLGDVDRAEELLKEAIVRFPDDEMVHTEAALLSIHKGDWTQADAWLQGMRERFPDSVIGWSVGVSVLRESGRLEQGEVLAQEAAERFASDPSFLLEFALLALTRGDVDEALRRTETLRKRFPKSPAGYRLAASALREAGRLKEARSLAVAGLRRFPHDFVLLNEQALIDVDKGNWADAASRWSAARKQFPTEPDAYVQEANARRQLGQLAQADRILAAAKVRFPREPRVTAEEAWLACDREDWRGAVALCKRMRQHFPDEPQGYAIAVVALLRMKKYSQAEALIGEGVKLFPQDREIRVQHAWTATEAGDWVIAKQRWEEIQVEFPQVQEAVPALLYASRFVQMSQIDAGVLTQPRQAPVITFGASHTRRHAQVMAAAEAADEKSEELRRVMIDFESLGDNCEFGAVQSRFRSETLGMLRWGTIYPEQLIAMLDARMEGVGLSENTFVDDGYDGEYGAGDKRYFFMHTFIAHDQARPDQLHRQICRRLSFLKDKFIQDLEEANKIFVYKSHGNRLSDENALGIWRAMQAYGPNRLLCVRPADTVERSGHVELVSQRLVHAYIHGLTQSGDNLDGHLDAWVKVCQTVHRLLLG
jgi:tetratricopeptide (TPR) repeat protein